MRVVGRRRRRRRALVACCGCNSEHSNSFCLPPALILRRAMYRLYENEYEKNNSRRSIDRSISNSESWFRLMVPDVWASRHAWTLKNEEHALVQSNSIILSMSRPLFQCREGPTSHISHFLSHFDTVRILVTLLLLVVALL